MEMWPGLVRKQSAVFLFCFFNGICDYVQIWYVVPEKSFSQPSHHFHQALQWNPSVRTPLKWGHLSYTLYTGPQAVHGRGVPLFTPFTHSHGIGSVALALVHSHFLDTHNNIFLVVECNVHVHCMCMYVCILSSATCTYMCLACSIPVIELGWE